MALRVSLVAIVVCAAAGTVLVLLVLWRIARRVRRRRDARLKPIPAPQPLAHHRAHHSTLPARPDTFYTPNPFPYSTASSRLSLRSTSPLLFPPGHGPARHASLPDASSSDLASVSDNEPLSARPFLHSDSPIMPPVSPSPSSQQSAFPSTYLDRPPLDPLGPNTPTVTPSTSARSSRPPRPASSSSHSHLRNRSQASTSYTLPRPVSLASNLTARNRTTATITTTIRGAPHGPHSHIEIILPAPLSESSNLGGMGTDAGPASRPGPGTGGLDPRHSRRMSVADGWASQLASGGGASGNASSGHLRAPSSRSTASLSRSSSRSHSTSRSRERPPLQNDSQYGPNFQVHPYTPRSRRTSQSSVSSIPSALSSVETPPSEDFPPPVPRIPSIYNALPSEHPPMPWLAHPRTDSTGSEGRYAAANDTEKLPHAAPMPGPGPPTRTPPANPADWEKTMPLQSTQDGPPASPEKRS